METGEDCSLEVGQIEQVRFLRRNGASFEKIKFHKKSMFPFGVWLGSPYRRETSDTTGTWRQMGGAHYVAKLTPGGTPYWIAT